MFCVVAVADNYAIGRGGDLLFHISPDLKRFKALTTGKAVIMGKKTLLSFPKSKPLPNRTNYVLSRNPDYEVEGAIVLHSLSEAKKVIDSYGKDEIACIGGAEIYRLLLPYVDTIELTRIYASVPDADTFFPELKDDEWNCEALSEILEDNKIKYQFLKYTRK